MKWELEHLPLRAGMRVQKALLGERQNGVKIQVKPFVRDNQKDIVCPLRACCSLTEMEEMEKWKLTGGQGFKGLITPVLTYEPESQIPRAPPTGT